MPMESWVWLATNQLIGEFDQLTRQRGLWYRSTFFFGWKRSMLYTSGTYIVDVLDLRKLDVVGVDS